MNSRENAFPTKQEGGGNDINGKNVIIPKAAAPSSSSTRPWSILKDPRIVRVSRSFGGKDRHSKVRTIRGLRDRRVRLSVQTALQLYDLQDRLGLNQPSKVVDWLLAAAQHDIDKLPPLPMENFMQYHAQYHQMPMVVSHHDHHFHSSQAVLPSSISSSYNGSTYGKGSSIGAAHQYPFSSTLLIKETSKVEANEENDQINTREPGKCKGNAVMGSSSTSTSSTHERTRALIRRSEEEGEENAVMGSSSTTSTNTLSRQSTTQELLPFASYYHWDYSSLNNPCVGGVLGYSSSSQTDHHDHQEVVPHIGLSSVSSSMGVGPPQLLLCPSIFPAPYNADYDPKYINHFQMVNQGSQNVMPR